MRSIALRTGELCPGHGDRPAILDGVEDGNHRGRAITKERVSTVRGLISIFSVPARAPRYCILRMVC